MNFFDNKDLGNHLLQSCPQVVKHPVYPPISFLTSLCDYHYRTPNTYRTLNEVISLQNRCKPLPYILCRRQLNAIKPISNYIMDIVQHSEYVVVI
jgi:hypothetical protein